MSRRQKLSVFILHAAAVLALSAGTAHAVPSFARQTGFECTVCHVSWPELTSVGRQFKLGGYTLGERARLPVAGMLQLARTSTSRVDPAVQDALPNDRDVLVQQASIFLSGKLSEHAGVFSQWSYDGVEHHSGIDNVDLRYANRIGDGDAGWLYGVTLHNNPTVQDVFNTGPAWGFPFVASTVAAAPNAATAIDSLGQQVAGLGAYALWHNRLYGEVSAYRTADRAFSVLRAGTDKASDAALKGWNPYWRLALQHESADGVHSAMLGAYGLLVERYPDPAMASGPTDRYNDVGLDAQYQYITDRHRASAQLNYVRERQHWNATATSNPADTLRSFRAKATYYYQRQYGATLGYFSLRGDADRALYDSGEPVTGSASGSPNGAGWIWELNYLPKRDIRLMLQYTAYRRFNGARSNYDGFGRNARDNNTLFLMGWFMF
jgi:hypothetical protein